VELGAPSAGDFGQAMLDRQMNVLVGYIEAEAARFDLALDLLQSTHDAVRFGAADQSHLGEHAGVGDRAPNVVPVEPAIQTGATR